jgi:hypothetical protein
LLWESALPAGTVRIDGIELRRAADVSVDAFGIGIQEKLGAVEAKAFSGDEGSPYPVAVALPRTYSVQVPVPHRCGHFLQVEPGLDPSLVKET